MVRREWFLYFLCEVEKVVYSSTNKMADFRKWRIHFNSLLAIRGFYFSWRFRRVAQIHFCSVLLILTKMVHSCSSSLEYT